MDTISETKKVRIEPEHEIIPDVKVEMKDAGEITLEEQYKRLHASKKIEDNQKFVSKNLNKFPNEATRILYQLPLNEKQRGAVFKALMKNK